MTGPTAAPGALHPRVLLLGRAGCHLCDEARVVVADVCSGLGQAWAYQDVDDHPHLRERYSDLVPVVLVDGADVAHYRVSSAVLRAALG